MLRGMASALLSHLTSKSTALSVARDHSVLAQEARDIVSELRKARFSDIAPPDVEAIQHAREHIESAIRDNRDMVQAIQHARGHFVSSIETNRDMEIELVEKLGQKRQIEGLEDMMAKMSAGSAPADTKKRPTAEDVPKLAQRLNILVDKLGLPPVSSQK